MVRALLINTRSYCGLGLAALLLTPIAGHAQIIDNSTVSYGQGQGDTDVYRIGTRRAWQKSWFSEGNWHVSGYWHLELGHWHSNKRGAHEDNAFEIAVTPVFRLEQKNADSGKIAPYLEAGVGARVIGPTSIGDRSLSSVFQIGTHLGTGLRFGSNGKYDLGYRFQHISNGGLNHPNNGIDMHTVNFGIHY
ncbi:MAG TPA: hypothetical protein DCF45_02295 [Gammaproteobacteria bacterium]|nr:hypothetical protein [Gammaproteobacteria bacterium]